MHDISVSALFADFKVKNKNIDADTYIDAIKILILLKSKAVAT